MNVTFHVLGSVATAAALCSRPKERNPDLLFSSFDPLKLGMGFLIGVILHGILDMTPHAYPIPSNIDVIFALLMFVIALFLVKKQYWFLITVCFVGCIFPDLVDLGPPPLNERLGLALPVVKIFPWHWAAYSGSIYDGSRTVESNLYHAIVIVSSLSILYTKRTAW